MDVRTEYTISCVILNVYFLSTTGLFFFCRNMGVVTVRLPNFVGLCSLFSIALMNIHLTQEYDFIYYSTPSFVTLWMYYLWIPSWLYCNLLRDLYFFFLHFLNASRLGKASSINSDAVYMHSKMTWSEKIMLKTALVIQRAVKKEFIFSKVIAAANNISTIKSSTSQSETNEESKQVSTMDISTLSSFNSTDLAKIIGYITIFNAIMALIVNVAFPGFGLIPLEYATNDQLGNMQIILYVLIFGYFIIKCFFIYSLKNINDCYGLKIEAGLTFAVMTVGYVFLVGRLPPWGGFTYMIIILTCLQTLSTVFPVLYGVVDNQLMRRVMKAEDVELAASPSAHPSKRGETASEKEKFQKVMKTPELYELFKKIVAQSYCLENILFLEEHKELKDLCGGKIVEGPMNPTLKKKLEKIISHYIIPNSSHELNINDQLRKDLLVNYGKDNVKFLGLLDQLNEEVIKMLVLNSFPRFVKAHGEKL
jgi:Regulator of G protein signaling domain